MVRRDPMLVIVLLLVVACTGVAALLGRSAWASACGAGVVAAMWAVEKLAARRGGEGSFAHGMAIGLGGMLARMALAVGVLAVIGVAASRDTFVDAALAFVASYTIYNGARLWWHPALPAGGRGLAGPDRVEVKE